MTITFNKKDSLLVIIGVVVILYATLQTAKGFELQTGGKFQSWVFAIIIGLLLTYLSISLKSKIANSKFLHATLIGLIYLFVAFFSFSANFNSFYSSTIRESLLSKYIDSLEQKTNTLSIEIENSLKFVPNKVTQLQITMGSQILDIRNKGWGKKTDEIAAEFEKLVGVKLTKPSGKPDEIVIALNKQIRELMLQRDSSLSDFKRSYVSQIDYIENQLKNLKDTSSITYQKSKIKELQTKYNSLCSESVTRTRDTINIKCSALDFEVDRIGQISHSFDHAFDHLQQATMPFFQSALLDLVLPLLIVFSTIFNRNGRKPNLEFPKRTSTR